MTQSFVALLPDRGVVSVTGADAEKLLQGLITNDMDLLKSQPSLYAGLLTPQGKILFDFLVVKSGDDFLLDVAREKAVDLVKRLTMYKLRASVVVRDVSDEHAVIALWGGTLVPSTSPAVPDPRLLALGRRAIVPAVSATDVIRSSNGEQKSAEAYHAHRIGLGVPEGGTDYGFGDTFPHEALFDQLNGVSFSKGCYVGQEIVSRMEHRSTARKRVVPVVSKREMPPTGTEIEAGGVMIGTLGSVAGRRGLALLRLDRAAEFMEKGVALTAGDVTLSIELPQFATFALPKPTGEAQS